MVHTHALSTHTASWVLPVPGRAGRFVMLGDRWDSHDLGASRYVWLPLWVDDMRPGERRWAAEEAEALRFQGANNMGANNVVSPQPRTSVCGHHPCVVGGGRVLSVCNFCVFGMLMACEYAC